MDRLVSRMLASGGAASPSHTAGAALRAAGMDPIELLALADGSASAAADALSREVVAQGVRSLSRSSHSDVAAAIRKLDKLADETIERRQVGGEGSGGGRAEERRRSAAGPPVTETGQGASGGTAAGDSAGRRKLSPISAAAAAAAADGMAVGGAVA